MSLVSSSDVAISCTSKLVVSLLDYGAGNVRSVRNAILKNGWDIVDITDPTQIETAELIIFPGVGSYENAMSILHERGYVEPLKKYLAANRPFLGICLGMQTLFDSSDECSSSSCSTTIKGLGFLPGHVTKFNNNNSYAVPHIGWNGRIYHQKTPVFQYTKEEESVYFVHSYYVPLTEEIKASGWVLTTTTYGNVEYVSAVQKGNVVAMQFHPEKSGNAGLNIIKGFLEAAENGTLGITQPIQPPHHAATVLAKRVVVALDVRSNDDGDLVVTKGDQYDVREKSSPSDDAAGAVRGGVRNLGKPVSLASRYYQEGADEIAFLNITSFRHGVLEDAPMLQVLEEASRTCFVPLTVGGGIRPYTDESSGKTYSAVEVAAQYFRAGADKVSIGSDAVYAAEQFRENQGVKKGTTGIEQISDLYGVQAVVVSIDPQRVYIPSDDDALALLKEKGHVLIYLEGEDRYCWYQCTVNGGRQARDICAVTVARASQALGAGEIMLNCINMDGQGKGFDHALMKAVTDTVTIPVIASSGAGNAEHFSKVFSETGVQAALAAGMFHRQEVGIDEVKKHMESCGIPSRICYYNRANTV